MKEGSRMLDGDPLLNLARYHLVTTRVGFTQKQVAFIEDCSQAAQKGPRSAAPQLAQRASAGGSGSSVTTSVMGPARDKLCARADSTRVRTRPA
jgi:hypothetical protein